MSATVVEHDGNGALEQVEGPKVRQSGGLVLVETVLQGATPLLMNAMSEEQLLALWDKEKPPKSAANPTLREVADSKVYRLPDGKPHVPVKNIYASFINAGQFIRLEGRKMVSTAKATTLPGIMTIEDVTAPLLTLDGQPARWEVDIQKGTNPNGGEAVCIIRPRFDDWCLSLTLSVDQRQLSLAKVRDLVDIAGKRIGLCDFRPQRKGTFGRFVVSAWRVLPVKK